MFFALFATVFWFLYVVVCPLGTLLGVFFAVRIGEDGRVSFVRVVLVTGGLIFVLAPAWTQAGPMAWWLAQTKIVSGQGNQYFVWQYTLVCVTLEAALFGLLRMRKRSAKAERHEG